MSRKRATVLVMCLALVLACLWLATPLLAVEAEPAWGKAVEGLRCRWVRPPGPFIAGTAPMVSIEVENISPEPMLWCPTLFSIGRGAGSLPGRILERFRVKTGPGARSVTAEEVEDELGIGRPGLKGSDRFPGFYRLMPGGRLTLTAQLPWALGRPGQEVLRAGVWRIWQSSDIRSCSFDFMLTCPPLTVDVLAAPESFSDAPWGKAREGVQVRLRTHKTVWQAGEVPTFMADIRNVGKRNLRIAQTGRLCEILVDGMRHRYAAEECFGAKRAHFGRGKEYYNIPVALDDQWGCVEEWRRLELAPGQHSVGAVLTAYPPDAEYGHVRAWSNRVRFEILPAEQQSIGPLVEGHAAAQDVFDRSKAFLTALAAGEDYKALAQTVPGSITQLAILSELRERYRLSQAGITDLYVGPDDAAVLTFIFRPRKNDPRVAMGIGLTRHDGGWLIRDTDALPGEEAISRYVDDFLEHFPGAQRFIVCGTNVIAQHTGGDVPDAGVAPVFSVCLEDDTVLDLDSATTAPRKTLWPEGFELAWNAADAELSVRRDSGVRLLLVPEAKNLGDAIEKARERLPDLEASEFASMRGLQAQYLAILTSEGGLAAVRVREVTPQHADLDFALGGMPVPRREPTSVGFGTVIERVVNDDGADHDSMIDFDDGRLFRSLGWNTRGARANGIDALCDTDAPVSGFKGIDMVVHPIPSRLWDTLSAEELTGQELWAFPRPGIPGWIQAQGELPATFAIKTREGGMGILQVVSFTEDPPGVNIRYKMVEAGERGT